MNLPSFLFLSVFAVVIGAAAPKSKATSSKNPRLAERLPIQVKQQPPPPHYLPVQLQSSQTTRTVPRPEYLNPNINSSNNVPAQLSTNYSTLVGNVDLKRQLLDISPDLKRKLSDINSSTQVKDDDEVIIITPKLKKRKLNNDAPLNSNTPSTCSTLPNNYVPLNRNTPLNKNTPLNRNTPLNSNTPVQAKVIIMDSDTENESDNEFDHGQQALDTKQSNSTVVEIIEMDTSVTAAEPMSDLLAEAIKKYTAVDSYRFLRSKYSDIDAPGLTNTHKVLYAHVRIVKQI